MVEVPKLKKNLFNPVYWEIKKYGESPTVSKVLIYGGKGSSKSLSIAQFFKVKAAYKGHSSIGFRKENTRIKKTLKKTLIAAGKFCKLEHCFEPLDFMWRAHDHKGCEIVLTGLEDEEKAKGVEGFMYALMDELNQFSYPIYEQVDLSLRGMLGQTLFATWNPTSENLFIKKIIIDKDEWTDVEHGLPSPDSFVRINKSGDTILIKTDYRDNYWAVGSPCGTYGFHDKALIAKYERLKITNHDSYLVNVLGLWGKITNESPFYPAFNKKKHVTKEKIPIDYSKQVLFTWDFNNEGCTCIVEQLFNDDIERPAGRYIYKTFEANNENEDENNSSGRGATEKVCDLVIESGLLNKIRDAQAYNMIRVTGDASGRQKTANSPKTNIEVIRNKWGLSKANMKFQKKNDLHSESKELCREVLYNIPHYIIESENPELISDLENGKDKKDKQGEFKGLYKYRDDGHKQDKGDAFRYASKYWFPGGYDLKLIGKMSIVKWMKHRVLSKIA